MNLQGTKSEKNLRAAFTGESIARNKYTFYAAAAEKAGHSEIAAAFERMAKNEMMHAKFWFELLNGAPSDTAAMLKDAMAGEFSEWHSMYPSFAAQAHEDGFEDLAAMFERVAAIEKEHEKQFLIMLGKLKESPGAAEKTKDKIMTVGYRCMFCGAVYEARPDACDVCHAIGSFEQYEYEK